MPLVLALLLALAPAAASAFEFPLTRMQRVSKLVDEGYESLQRGDYLRAAETCARALELRGDYAPAYLCRSEARLKNGDPDADKDAMQALLLDPKSGDAYRVLGLYEFESGRVDEAIKHFDRALERSKLRPDEVPNVYYYRARAKLKLGNLDDALKDADRGMAILVGISGNYSDWSFYSLRAEIRRKLGRTKEADEDEGKVLTLLDERMRRRPREATELMRMKAESHALLRDYDSAAKDYADILAKGQGGSGDRLERADALISAERHEEAVSELTGLLARDPKNARALKLRGYALIRLNKQADALLDLDEALKLRPKDAATLSYRAIARLDLEDFKGALADIGAAQVLLPAEADALEARKAFAYARIGRYEDAMAASAKALKRNPESYSANIARARAATALGRCAEALPAVDWLIEKVPQSGEYRALRADCTCGGDGRAVPAARPGASCLVDSEKAAALSPDSGVYALDLARRHRRWLDDLPLRADEAELRRSVRFFERAAELSPLDAADLLLYGRTLHELARTPGLPDEESAKLGTRALDACRSALKERPRDKRLRRLCDELDASSPRPKTAQKTDLSPKKK
ncbi:MAG: tetratricopeptide repeat protein [Elusimicrobiota bacterium]|jgi:tetratricopeptide (TPR) repeat protein